MLSQKTHHYLTAFFVLVLIIHNSSTPNVEAGPVTYVACILACCGTSCSSVAAACGILGASTGPAAIIAAVGCLLAAGGGCAMCVTTCQATVALPTM